MDHVDHVATEHRSHLVIALADAADVDLLAHISRVNEHIHSERGRGGVCRLRAHTDTAQASFSCTVWRE